MNASADPAAGPGPTAAVLAADLTTDFAADPAADLATAPAGADAVHAALYRRLLAFEFDDPDAALPFSRRLARDNGWTHRGALRAIDEYRRFAYLALAAGHPVTPSDQVDQVWHLHLAYTRSYWEDFCPRVLGCTLHHGPTRGGADEGAKYEDWYRRTLASYEYCFGAPPPRDLWPPPDLRFGRDLAFVRVNRRRYWLLPRAPHDWGALLLRPLRRLRQALAGGGLRGPVSR